MQLNSNFSIYDTTNLTVEHPVSPEGKLFSYYPSQTPDSLHHHDFIEIGYSEYGTGIFISNGEPITFNGKCAAIFYSGQPHIAKSIDAEKSLWHFLYIDPNCLFSNGKFVSPAFLQQMKFYRHEFYRFPNVLPQAAYPEIYDLCQEIISEAAAGGDYIPVVQGLLYALVHKHERLFSKAENQADRQKSEGRINLLQELGETINFITRNYTEKITIEELLAVSKMSKSTLQRKIIEYTGYSPLQYVHELRLKHAMAALLDKRKSIEQIAYEVGYDLSSFNRQFKKRFSVTPSDFRKEDKNPNA